MKQVNARFSSLLAALTAALFLTFPAQAQSITSIRPESGGLGSQVRIYGSGFGASPTVTFASSEAPVDSTSSNVIYARVPEELGGGPVKVSVTAGNATVEAPDRFQVLTGGSNTFGPIEPALEVMGESGFVPSIRSESDWGDYDGDGDLDLVATQQVSTTIYENRGGRTFAALDAGLTDVRYGSVDWVDYDGDGDLDLFVMGRASGGPNTTLYENEGGGSFSPVGAGLPGADQGGADWGDYDGDGDPDVAIVGAGTDSTITDIFENEGGGSFSPVQAGLDEVALNPSVEWGDYDGDDDLDLVVTGATFLVEGRTTTIYENQGGGTFAPADAGLPGVELGTATWADYDRDGDLDLAVAGDGGSEGRITRIYQNEGGGSFTPVDAGLTGADEPALEWGDYNGDGNPDLIVTGTAPDGDGKTAVYSNSGGGTFREVEAGLPDLSSGSPESANWVDYDSDGDLDLFLTGSDSSSDEIARIYENGLIAVDALEVRDGVNDFEEGTGVDILFTNTPFITDVETTVEKLAGRPSNTTGIAESTVSTYRFSIRLSGDLEYDSTSVAFQVDSLGGISDPTDVTIYKRDSVGTGSFEALETTVGDNGTPGDISDDTLYVSPDSYSEFVLASNTNELPVDLASFNGRATRSSAHLTWQTASETGNAGFEVQWQKEKEGWTQVGYVESKAQGGTTTETTSYSYTIGDLPVGTHQFRLKQVDLVGSSTLIDPVSVDIQMQEAVKLTAPAPNPASSSAALSFAVKEQAETTITLYNTLGQQVATLYEGTPQAGEQQTAQVDVSGLPSGTYFVRLRADGQTRTQRLTVVR